MIKSILAAVDGSEESLAGLDQAVNWAERLQAELRVVYVEDERQFVTFPTYSDSEGGIPRPIPLEGEALANAEAESAAQVAVVRDAYSKAVKGRAVRADFAVVRGPVEATLIDAARGTDMVVLGKRGRGLAEHIEAAGPTTETLIHEALRPVLVVPKGARTTGPVLLPFDGSRSAQRAVVPGAQLAAALQVPAHVLTLAADTATGEAIQMPLREYLRPHGVEAEFKTVEGKDTERTTARLILGEADDLQAGLIVMGAFSVGPLREFFLGSVTRDVLTHAPCPVLMMS